jgi:hypothetical protein
MAEENAYLELFRAGLAFVGGTFSGILTNINAKRLEEKGKRKKKRSNNFELNESEKLKGEVSLDIERASGLIQNPNYMTKIEIRTHLIDFEGLKVC